MSKISSVAETQKRLLGTASVLLNLSLEDFQIKLEKQLARAILNLQTTVTLVHSWNASPMPPKQEERAVALIKIILTKQLTDLGYTVTSLTFEKEGGQFGISLELKIPL